MLGKSVYIDRSEESYNRMHNIDRTVQQKVDQVKTGLVCSKYLL